MKKSKIAVIVSLLLAVSVFGAACKSEETTKKKKSTKKTKVEDTDDEDETKKTKKTKKTEDTDDTEETDAPSETTEDTKETDAPTETTENTTPSESTTDTTPMGTTGSTRTPYDIPTPKTDGYKAISPDEFTSIVKSKGYTVTDALAMDADAEAKALLLAYDQNYDVMIVYYQYLDEESAADAYQETVDLTDDFSEDEYEFVVTDKALISYSDVDDEYTVVVYCGDVQVMAVTSTDINNINTLNDMMAELGYPVT